MTVNPPLTLSTAPLEHPAMDYAFLRQEGIQWLERLAGPEWTDFNTHDPGITILEQLCYALTDLGHRIAYDLPDLLSSAGVESYDSLYSPAQLLTTQPVTLEDLRKLVIDVEGVKNAWIEPVTDVPPPFYVEADTGEVRLQPDPAHTTPVGAPSTTAAVQLRGLYRVLIQISDLLYLDNNVNHELVRRQVAQRLHANRSLGEDFAEIQVLDPELIQVQARVEIASVEDAAAILLAIYQRLAAHIAPPVRFTALRDLLAAGEPVDEIFAGPRLAHGFIATAALRQAQRRTTLRTSDLIHEIMAVPGVRAVRTISIAAGGSGVFQPWSLDLDRNKAPKLDLAQLEPPQLDLAQAGIRLERNGLPVSVNYAQVRAAYEAHLRDMATGAQTAPAEQDLPLPRGRDRHIGNYYSLQHQFPAVYGIGALGLPDSASPQRQAQAQQLKAYLLFFDQLLANTFAQLAHAPELLAFGANAAPTDAGHSNHSYFAQALDDPRLGLAELRRSPPDVHQATLQQMTENPQARTPAEGANSALRRRDRFLNHLLARFAEPLTDYALLHGTLGAASAVPLAKVVEDKQRFLQEYPALSGGRGGAFNYLQPWSSTNRAGLEKRIARKLGLVAAAGERFCLVEHILLRPLPEDATTQGALLTLADPQRPDPYSLQLTFAFPQGPPRFQDSGFKAFIERTVREETPAHLVVHLLWLDASAMAAFETAYTDWLAKLRGYWLEKLGE